MWRGLLVLLFVLGAGRAHAYGVGPAIPLEELAKKVDLITKATVIGGRRVADRRFATVAGYDVEETELRVVSSFKGKPGKTIRFRHYVYAPKPNEGYGYSPLAYELPVGRTYLIFALAGKDGAYLQFQKDHTQQEGQGVLPAGDDKPHQGTTITDAAFAELRNAAAGASPAIAVEAIEELDEMSGGGLSKLKDFDRGTVLSELKPLILAKDDQVATAAITVFGADGPYFVDRDAPYWLAGVGKGEIPGLVPRKPSKLPGAVIATKELMDVAAARPALKALAIRALGRTRTVPTATLAGWARDTDPEVRRAAILVSAEGSDRSLINAGVTDKVAQVRATAALAIGFSQDPKLLRLLDALLKDPEGEVRAAAAMSMLSFSLDDARPFMKAQLGGNYGSLFVNALARKDPAPYLVTLGEVIEKQLQPTHWWGGKIPAYDSWQLLFDYLRKQPEADLAAGKFDRSFDSLEKMKWGGSSEPTKLYALYIQMKLTARAKNFRDGLKKSISYPMDEYLDRAAQNPTAYLQ